MTEVLEETPVTEPAEPEPATVPEPDDEPDDEDEPDETPDETPDDAPVEAAQTQKEIDKRNEKLKNEAERHAQRVNQILGEDALPLIQCEACPPNIPGWHYPADQFPPDSPSRLLYEMLASDEDVLPPRSSRYVRCETCDGHTKLDTQSRDPLQRFIVCWDCRGKGYHDREESRGAVVALPQANGAAGDFTPPQTPKVETDFLGRPVGHPNYGKMTTYLTADELLIDQRDGFAV